MKNINFSPLSEKVIRVNAQERKNISPDRSQFFVDSINSGHFKKKEDIQTWIGLSGNNEKVLIAAMKSGLFTKDEMYRFVIAGNESIEMFRLFIEFGNLNESEIMHYFQSIKEKLEAELEIMPKYNKNNYLIVQDIIKKKILNLEEIVSALS
jgi:hypothetical protein